MRLFAARLTTCLILTLSILSPAAALAQGFSDGVFLAAGSLDDGAGGAILAYDEDRDALVARVSADPFVREGIVTAEITGFTPARTDARLGFLKVAE